MEEMDKSLSQLCKEFDGLAGVSDRHEVLDLMDRLADIRNKVASEDRATAKAIMDHEEAKQKIKATFAIQESKEVREDRQLELEEQKVEIEQKKVDIEEQKVELDKEQLTSEERAEIAKAAIAGTLGLAGTVTTGILGYKGIKAGLQNTANIFANLNEWDKNDVIPLSTGWDLFKKGFKG